MCVGSCGGGGGVGESVAGIVADGQETIANNAGKHSPNSRYTVMHLQ